MSIDEILDKLYRASNFLKEGILTAGDPDDKLLCYYGLELEYRDIKELVAALLYFKQQRIEHCYLQEMDGMNYFRIKKAGKILENKVMVYLVQRKDQIK